jgi:hypothetical protein
MENRLGLYDTIIITDPCPYCGLRYHITAQTKDLGRLMNHYYTVPENINSKLWKKFIYHGKQLPKTRRNKKQIKIYAGCSSVKCQFDADRRDILRQGIPSGFGRMFDATLYIKEGYIMKTLHNIELDKYTEKYLNSYKKENRKKFLSLKKKYKHEPIITRFWGVCKEPSE